MPTIRATPQEIKEIEDRLAAGLPPFPDPVATGPVAPPKVTEEDFLKQVLTLARSCGWRTAHFRPAMTKGGKWITAVQGDGKGFPDLVLLRDDEFIIAELKVPPNTITPEQRGWLDAFSQTGACENALLWVCTWTPADWPTIETFLARKI